MRTGIRDTFRDLKGFDWKLFISLCLTAIVPAIYQTIRTFLISTSVSVEGIDIIGQMEWFDLINETILAFLVIPLYSIFNRLREDRRAFGALVFKLGILVIVLYILFQFGVCFYAEHLVRGMNPADSDRGTITAYLRIETVAFMIGIVYSVGNVILVVLGRSRNVYILLAVNAVTLVISDFVLVPRFGVMGVAYSNILVNALLGVIAVGLIAAERSIRISWFDKGDRTALKRWSLTGLFAGSQSLLDNLIYAVMVVKMVNMVAEQGNYWVANNFIWGWMLIPITALSEVIKKDATDYRALKQRNYYLIVLFSVILWCISIPLWTPFFRYVEKLDNYGEIFRIVLSLFPFYIAYGLYTVPDSIFIGLGKTQYNAINSAVINLVYYGLFFILYITDSIVFDMTTIILMFGFGNVTHLIISYIEQYVFVRRFRKDHPAEVSAKEE